MKLKGKKVLVVGIGKTGLSTSRFLLKKGAAVTLSDNRKNMAVPHDIIKAGAAVETGSHNIATFTNQDLIVVSPGVPLIIRPIIEAQAKGIEVISEIELAYRFLNTPLIAVTGTNGKTTTTSLLQHIFQASGKNVFTGGNIGTPLIEYVSDEQKADYVIAEISSFQLDCTKYFRPHISVLLNISEDHLDRYPSFDAYAHAKSRIFMNQGKSDITILNYDDSIVKGLAEKTNSSIFFFSTKKDIEGGAYYKDSLSFCKTTGEKVTIPGGNIKLKGEHNRQNIIAAASVAFLCRLPADTIQSAIFSFTALSHRMEFVEKINSVSFFNDSKGTNVGACIKSLESLEPSIILIAGGKDKGGSYLPLREIIEKKVKVLILLGEARKRIAEEVGTAIPTVMTESLEKAVTEAFIKAGSGDTVLFSPACSSFDMFKNYEHRGECFKSLVRNLRKAI